MCPPDGGATCDEVMAGGEGIFYFVWCVTWIVVAADLHVQQPPLAWLVAPPHSAGIVAGSEPQSELEETGNKMRTVLNALGIEIRENMEVVQ